MNVVRGVCSTEAYSNSILREIPMARSGKAVNRLMRERGAGSDIWKSSLFAAFAICGKGECPAGRGSGGLADQEADRGRPGIRQQFVDQQEQPVEERIAEIISGLGAGPEPAHLAAGEQAAQHPYRVHPEEGREHVLRLPIGLDPLQQPAVQAVRHQAGEDLRIAIFVGGSRADEPARAQYPGQLARHELGVLDMLECHVADDHVEMTVRKGQWLPRLNHQLAVRGRVIEHDRIDVAGGDLGAILAQILKLAFPLLPTMKPSAAAGSEVEYALRLLLAHDRLHEAVEGDGAVIFGKARDRALGMDLVQERVQPGSGVFCHSARPFQAKAPAGRLIAIANVQLARSIPVGGGGAVAAAPFQSDELAAEAPPWLLARPERGYPYPLEAGGEHPRLLGSGAEAHREATGAAPVGDVFEVEGAERARLGEQDRDLFRDLLAMKAAHIRRLAVEDQAAIAIPGHEIVDDDGIGAREMEGL